MQPPKLAEQAVALTNSAFASGKLKPLGFDPEKQFIDRLNLRERALLSKCVGSLLEYRYLMSRAMTSLSSFDYFSLFSDSIRRIENAEKTTRAFRTLAKLENMPDFAAVYPMMGDALRQVPGSAIRANRGSLGAGFHQLLPGIAISQRNISRRLQTQKDRLIQRLGSS
jgi:hypothetical protein